MRRTLPSPSSSREPLARAGALLAAALLAPALPALGQPAVAPFVERAAAVGLDFVHFSGMSGGLYLLEVAGSGGALFDYDNDGDLDVYLVQGTMIEPGKTLADATAPPPPDQPPGDRLFRNDLALDEAGEPRLVFVDVTASARIDAPGYGMGVATGDYDDDGWVDLYVTNYGSNQLLRNNGDGTFADVTAATRTDDPRWSVSASFVDFDGDGRLDLYVGNYLAFDFALDSTCTSQTGAPDYCGPLAYKPQPDRLFRNRGDGTFEDWTDRGGVAAEYGGALGVVSADFNGDALPDIYVANDMMPNQLWINQGEGRFANDALFAGAAVNWEGKPEASMGVDAGDFDGDGDEDLFMAHLRGETNTLYRNDGSGIFTDATRASGLANSSWSATAFGTAWFDYDNDGLLDLLTANGAVKTIEKLALAGDPFPLHEPNQLFRNRGDDGYEDVTAAAGPAFELSEVSRGAAFGDIDNDGDVDVLVTNNSGPVRLLVNQVGNGSHWLGGRLLGGPGPRDQLGARVGVWAAGRPPLWRRVRADASYASANDPRVLAGLGATPEARVERLRLRWPGGATTELRQPPIDRYAVLYAPGPQAP